MARQKWSWNDYYRLYGTPAKNNAAEQPVPKSRAVPILSAGATQCRWPLWGSSDESAKFVCGEATAAGRVYCKEHCRAAYTSVDYAQGGHPPGGFRERAIVRSFLLLSGELTNSPLVEAVAVGDVTPSEGAELSKVLDGYTRAVEAADVQEHLARLEAQERPRGEALT